MGNAETVYVGDAGGEGASEEGMVTLWGKKKGKGGFRPGFKYENEKGK